MDVQFIKIIVLVSLVLSFMVCVSSGFTGYSYAKFRGPVSGPEREVNVVHDDGKYHYHNHHHHKGAHDYVAKPDYHFAYGVEDPKSMVKQSRHETRYGDDVKGEYSVLDPDGKYRTVKYTVDKHNGFQAEIITDGNHHSVDHYPMPPVEYTPQAHAHEVHHHEEYAPHEVHHHYTPQAQAHEVHHHEEDTKSYNEEESSEGGGAYDETDDTSDNESSSEDNDDGEEYY